METFGLHADESKYTKQKGPTEVGPEELSPKHHSVLKTKVTEC